MGLLFDAVVSNLTDRPFNLEFAVTNLCNCRCIQCSVWKHYLEKPERVGEELKAEEVRRIFSSYKGFSVIGITALKLLKAKLVSR
jgi:molybdenum cofactor biosynthesis enzyme MoaA